MIFSVLRVDDHGWSWILFDAKDKYFFKLCVLLCELVRRRLDSEFIVRFKYLFVLQQCFDKLVKYTWWEAKDSYSGEISMKVRRWSRELSIKFYIYGSLGDSALNESVWVKSIFAFQSRSHSLNMNFAPNAFRRIQKICFKMQSNLKMSDSSCRYTIFLKDAQKYRVLIIPLSVFYECDWRVRRSHLLV